MVWGQNFIYLEVFVMWNSRPIWNIGIFLEGGEGRCPSVGNGSCESIHDDSL